MHGGIDVYTTNCWFQYHDFPRAILIYIYMDLIYMWIRISVVRALVYHNPVTFISSQMCTANRTSHSYPRPPRWHLFSRWSPCCGWPDSIAYGGAYFCRVMRQILHYFTHPTDIYDMIFPHTPMTFSTFM